MVFFNEFFNFLIFTRDIKLFYDFMDFIPTKVPSNEKIMMIKYFIKEKQKTKRCIIVSFIIAFLFSNSETYL